MVTFWNYFQKIYLGIENIFYRGLMLGLGQRRKKILIKKWEMLESNVTVYKEDIYQNLIERP